MSLEWREKLDGEMFEADVIGGRRAHILVSRGEAHWWIDGEEQRRAGDVPAAMAAVEAFLRGFGFELKTGNDPGRVQGSRHEAEPAGVTLVYGEDGVDDDRDLVAAMAAARPPSGTPEAEQVRERIEARLFAAPRGLLSRISESAPAQLRDELRSRARRVESFLGSVRELAAGDADDPELVAVLQAEAAGAARELAEAGVEVLRDLRRDLAVAKAIEDAHQADLDAARERSRSIKAAIKRVEETILRPACEAAGTGDTRRLDLATARVAIWKNPARVEIEEGVDARLLDERFQRVSVDPDKEAIKAALSNKEDVPGCKLVSSTRIEVR